MIAVVVMAADAGRVSEALRAAVGLGLRGDPVEALLVGAAADLSGPGIERALGTLVRLGRPARRASLEEARAIARRARAVEVWTSPGQAARRLELAGGASIAVAGIDSRRLVEQIFEADGAVLW